MSTKRILIFVLVSCMVLTGVAFGAMHLNVMVDGVMISSDVEPTMTNNRILVPVRAIAEGLGADVMWDGASMTVTITSPEKRFAASFMEKAGYANTGAQAAAMMKMDMENVMVLDVRPPAHRAISYIKDSIHVPLTTIPDSMDMFTMGKTYLVYCASDINAAYATMMLNMAGYDAYVVQGGMQALADNGFMIVTP